MLKIIAFLALGILLGRVLRRREIVPRIADRLMTLTIYAFLFFLGITVGVNEQIIANLPHLGLKALIIAIVAIAGSIIASYPVYHFFFRDIKK